MHATNEQMAEIMDFPADTVIFHGKKDGLQRGSTFNPVADLNHARLVEGRIKELWLQYAYIGWLIKLIKQHKDPNLDYNYKAVLLWATTTADAQTRCDAAWAAFSEWRARQ